MASPGPALLASSSMAGSKGVQRIQKNPCADYRCSRSLALEPSQSMLCPLRQRLTPIARNTSELYLRSNTQGRVSSFNLKKTIEGSRNLFNENRSQSISKNSRAQSGKTLVVNMITQRVWVTLPKTQAQPLSQDAPSRAHREFPISPSIERGASRLSSR